MGLRKFNGYYTIQKQLIQDQSEKDKRKRQEAEEKHRSWFGKEPNDEEQEN
jgi:hypothetical protein